MITGNETKVVARYLPLDPGGEGYTWVKPEGDEEFIGHPYGFHGENSFPFIEVKKAGRTIKTVNFSDIAEIEFVV